MLASSCTSEPTSTSAGRGCQVFGDNVFTLSADGHSVYVEADDGQIMARVEIMKSSDTDVAIRVCAALNDALSQELRCR